MPSDERQRRLAANEARFRDINESLNRELRPLSGDEERISFVCECVRPDCRTPVEMTLAEYELVRGNPRRFAVAIGHAESDVETVMERHDTYLVVEKIEAGAEVAEDSDPRG